MQILGVNVSPVKREEALSCLNTFLDEPRGHLVTTPNSEIVLYAHRHPAYRDILNKADLALPDGAGLIVASRILGKPLAERVSGSDMVPEICRLAREKGLKIALLGGLDHPTIEKAATVMRGWGNEVVYASHGVAKGEWENTDKHDKIIDELRALGPELVFVGFGHPKQEQWIDEFRSHLPSVRLFLGCGGSLDFIAGVAKRAPRIFRPWLEWLWRLLIEPRRLKRIWNATVVFQLTVIYESFRKK